MLTPDEKIIFNLCIPKLGKQPIVFDIGAYKGEYTDYVLSQLPEAKCYLFEPNIEVSRELSTKHKNTFDIALGSQRGKAIFWRCLGKADELSSTYRRPVFGEVEYVEEVISIATVDTFCEFYHIDKIDFLKIDVEGAELDVLLGSKDMLSSKSIHFIQVEYGGTYPDAGITFKEVLSFIIGYGYSAYELVNEKFAPITLENFVEDYRFANFLITCHDIG